MTLAEIKHKNTKRDLTRDLSCFHSVPCSRFEPKQDMTQGRLIDKNYSPKVGFFWDTRNSAGTLG